MRLIQKMMRAAKLDIAFYEEVEKDEEASKEAFLVVMIVGICSGIGTLGSLESAAIFKGLISAIVGWILWSVIIFLAAMLLNRRVGIGELLRCLGFAYSPHVFNILGVIPIIRYLVFMAVFFWGLVTFIVAVRQALDCETGKAILVVILSSIPYVLIRIAFTV